MREAQMMNTVSDKDLHEFVTGYLDTAVWSSIDADGEFLEIHYTSADFSHNARESAIQDCKDFLTNNFHIIDGRNLRVAGGDFWLTRNNHETGFLDTSYGEDGRSLAKATLAYNKCSVYPDAFGELHFCLDK